MINRKRSDFIDHFWTLSEKPFSPNSIFSQKRKYRIKASNPLVYTNSQYIMNELKNTDMFISHISPSGNITKNIIENIMATDSFIVEESLNLSEVNTWLKLWDMDVGMVEYSNNILKYLSANDYYTVLVWYVDKIKQIEKEDFDKNEIVKNILNEAIRNNNPDIIQYIAIEFGDNFSYLTDKISVIESVCELASMQNVNQDYCINVIGYLDKYGFFSSILYPDKMLRMIYILFEEMGHKQCASIIHKYFQDSN